MRRKKNEEEEPIEGLADEFEIDQISRLSKDLRMAARNLSIQEARYYVDMYYITQDSRKAVNSQIKTMNEDGEPHLLLDYLLDQFRIIEQQIKGTLKIFAENNPVGEWCTSIMGIGPVIAAGLLAHIDITKCPTAGHIMSYGGVYPGIAWEKKKLRPWNARLKVLIYLIGKSFVKTSKKDGDYYGKIYRNRKDLEETRNNTLIKLDGYDNQEYKNAIKEVLVNAEDNGLAYTFWKQAADKLRKFKIGKNTDAYGYYSKGQLPPAHIEQRAERYAAKMFLYHYHEVAYVCHYGYLPPLPFVQEHLGHVDITSPPGFDLNKYVTSEYERQFRLRKKYEGRPSYDIIRAMERTVGDELDFTFLDEEVKEPEPEEPVKKTRKKTVRNDSAKSEE